MNQTLTLTLAECPADIRDYFLSDPAYQSAIKIVKTSKRDSDTPSIVEKTLKTGIRHIQKAAPGFAEILGGSVSRDNGTPAPAEPKAPPPTTAPTDAVIARANAGAGITRQATNTPKETTLYGRGNSVEWKDLQEAMNVALMKQRDEHRAEAFNEKRSAFSRLTPTKASDVAGGGSGNAWSLRNMGGKLAASLLNSTVHKNDKPLPKNTGFRAVSGESLRG